MSKTPTETPKQDAGEIPEGDGKRARLRNEFYRRFEGAFNDIWKLLKIGTPNSYVKNLSKDQLADRLASVVLPNSILDPQIFRALLPSMDLHVGELPSVESYQEMVVAGAEAIKNARPQFKQFLNILTLLTPADFDAFLNSFLTVSSISFDRNSVLALAEYSPAFKSKEEAAHSIGTALSTIKNCYTAFVGATGATVGSRDGRPPSAYTLIASQIVELWEELTSKPIVYPKSNRGDYELLSANDKALKKKQKRVRSSQTSTQFVFEVMQMIFPKITLNETETGIRNVLDTRGQYPIKGVEFRIAHYLNRQLVLGQMDAPSEDSPLPAVLVGAVKRTKSHRKKTAAKKRRV